MSNYEAALLTIQETIRVAQQRNEHESVALAQAWLFRIGQMEHLSQEETQSLINTCIAKSKELHLHYLTSQCHLESAKLHNYTSVQRNNPQSAHNVPRALLEIQKSDRINSEHGFDDLKCTTFLTRAATWETFGNKRLVRLKMKFFLI